MKGFSYDETIKTGLAISISRKAPIYNNKTAKQKVGEKINKIVDSPTESNYKTQLNRITHRVSLRLFAQCSKGDMPIQFQRSILNKT